MLSTKVMLVGRDDREYPSVSNSADSQTQLTSVIDLASVPLGTYSILATRADGFKSVLEKAFTVTASGQSHLETSVILPSAVGIHDLNTIYVEYANTGEVAMHAPLLVLELTDPALEPVFTLDPSKRIVAYSSPSGLRAPGTYKTAQILASGEIPGILGPGESAKIPVYWCGMLPSGYSYSVEFRLRILQEDLAETADFKSLLSPLRPPDMSETTWMAMTESLAQQIGSKSGGFVKLLNDQASYLGTGQK